MLGIQQSWSGPTDAEMFPVRLKPLSSAIDRSNQINRNRSRSNAAESVQRKSFLFVSFKKKYFLPGTRATARSG